MGEVIDLYKDCSFYKNLKDGVKGDCISTSYCSWCDGCPYVKNVVTYVVKELIRDEKKCPEMELKEYIKKLIQGELKVRPETIIVNNCGSSDEKSRFWVDVLDENFNGDMDNGDPILEQYVLVPISKMQDRLGIILGR